MLLKESKHKLYQLVITPSNRLTILPVLNKIDLPQADPDRVKKEIEEIIGIDASNAPCISAKNGEGTEELLNIIVEEIPSPEGKSTLH